MESETVHYERLAICGDASCVVHHDADNCDWTDCDYCLVRRAIALTAHEPEFEPVAFNLLATYASCDAWVNFNEDIADTETLRLFGRAIANAADYALKEEAARNNGYCSLDSTVGWDESLMSIRAKLHSRNEPCWADGCPRHQTQD